MEQPGYYAVTLSDYDVRAELTASRRVGWHRYTFPTGKPAHVLLDLRPSIYDYPGKVLWANLQVHADGTVTGCRTTRGWAPGRELCFAMRFNQPMTSRELYNRETDVIYKGFKGPGNQPEDQNAQNGRALVGVFDFGDLKQPLLREGGDLVGKRSERHRQSRSRRAGLGLRRASRRRHDGMEQGAVADRCGWLGRRCARSSTPRCITR